MDYYYKNNLELLLEESTDFDNSHMFEDDGTNENLQKLNKSEFDHLNKLMYGLQSSANNSESLSKRSNDTRRLEESTYNSFMNLFDNSAKLPENTYSSNSFNGQSRYSTGSTSVFSSRHKSYTPSELSTVTSNTSYSDYKYSNQNKVVYNKNVKDASHSKLKKSVTKNEEDALRRSTINLEFYDLTSEDYNGVPFNFSLLFDKVVMIVNVASFCGFTNQYKELEKLYETYNSKGFEIIAFPSNQFLQEPKKENDIVEFCSLKFNVSFPIMKKIRVNGKNSSPIYDYLKAQKKGLLNSKRVFWNFEKFIVDKRGNVVDRASSFKKPQEFEKLIVSLLEE